ASRGAPGCSMPRRRTAAGTGEVSGFTRRVWAYLAPHRLPLAGALAQVALISACELLKPWPLKIIIDRVLTGQPAPWAWAAGASSTTLLLGACAALVLVYGALGGL